MDFFIELLLDLLFEGSIEISKNKKVPKWIRFPLIVLIVLVFTILILGILLLGVLFLKSSLAIGTIIIILGIVMLTFSLRKFKEIYVEKVEVKK